MRVSYEYKQFYGAPELEIKSKRAGYFATWPFYVMGGLALMVPVLLVLTEMGITSDYVGIICWIACSVLVRSFLRKLRDNKNEKLQQQYIAKLNVMRDTNPAEYYRIVQVLQSRQK